MTHHDFLFRKSLKRDAPKMPSDMSARFDETVASFRPRPRPAFRIVRAAALIVLAVLLIIPNLSPTIAYAAQEIPVIGGLFKVFSIYKLEQQSENHYQSIDIPQVESGTQSDAAIDYINADVATLTSAAIAEYEATVEAYPDSHTGLMIDYDVVTNTSQWFTLRLMVYRDAASGSVQYYFYHIDKLQGKLVTLCDLFREDFDYQTPISQEIKSQMRRQHADNPNMVYWLDDDNSINYAFEQISAEQNFYFNDDGDLVIVFGKYEVAPGYMGCPEFTIPSQVYADGLAAS